MLKTPRPTSRHENFSAFSLDLMLAGLGVERRLGDALFGAPGSTIGTPHSENGMLLLRRGEESS
jgi:hypothetical protein